MLESYSGDVAVVAASIGDTANDLIRYRDENSISDRIAFAVAPQIRRDYSVTSQSTKVAVGRDGVIIERKGYRTDPSWPGMLNRLLET